MTTTQPVLTTKEGLAGRLQVLYPNAEAGQKIQVTYTVYRGSNQAIQTTFIKDAAGNYEVFEG